MDPRLLANMKVAACEGEQESEVIEKRYSKCDEVQAGVDRLPPALRKVVVDIHFLGRSQWQIADEIGVSQALVWQRHKEALMILEKDPLLNHYR